uniref:centriolin isoform X1 n=1 Tax=Ciona intestinalis TaxID=7719 RepID=UPI00089DB5C8|nr:centriolin isoform X1 [Ciona intestinalis]|eukprot:XP_018670943.1 centriolin isoform X1 [Ciona intestinalis]
MKRSKHTRGGSTDDSFSTAQRKSATPRSTSVPSSRIPSPTRVPAAVTSRSSRASTPQRSRSSSMSPTRGGAISPTCSAKSLENLSPIRPPRNTQLMDSGGSGRNLVRYITQDLIKRLAKEDVLEHIQQLNFTLTGEKRVRYIENLEGLKNLNLLNLGGNVIQRMEKLDHLTRLRHLNLSHNKISKLEGIETLVHLQVLNIESNYIERIPTWLPKKLRALRTIRLAENKIESLNDVTRLRTLHDLHIFTIAGNDLCGIPHHRHYIIFHLRSLDQLDGKNISSSERNEASSRFSQEELDRLSKDLNDTMYKLEQSQEGHNQSLEEIEILVARERESHDRENRGKESREELERELDSKDDLLKKKAKELQKAQAKQYQLEQELAFIKLDAKFEPLSMPIGESDGEGDSPYIGKSRYKRNEMALESEMQPSMHQIKPLNDENRRKLDGQIAEKQRQLNEAAERLASLQRELRETQNQVVTATQELHRLEHDTNARKLSEAEKMKIRQRLAAKIKKINEIKDEAEKMEDLLSRGRAEVQRSKLEYDRIRANLKHLDPNAPEFNQAKSDMKSKEQQIKELTQQIKSNEAHLDRLLKNIAIDTEAIKQLEEHLEGGTATSDDALRQELEDIVGGLQDYLINVRRKADAQRNEFDDLLRDKERLVRRLAALEQEKSILAADVDDYGQLQAQISVLGELNDLLQATQDLNESILGERGQDPVPSDITTAIREGIASPLQVEKATRLTLDALNKSMSDMNKQNSALQREANELSVHEGDLQRQLEAAESRIQELHGAMQDSEHRGKEDREKLGKQMEEIARLQNKVGDREEEARAVKKELSRMKNKNQNLAKELEARNSEFNDTIGSLLQPDDVLERLNGMQEALKRGDRSAVKFDKDPVGNALATLNEAIFDRVDKGNQGKAEAEKKLNSLEQHMSNLKKKLMQAQQEYRETMEAATAAKIGAEKHAHERALKRLDDEMKKMKDKLIEAEDDVALMRAVAHKEREKLEEDVRAREERARLRDARLQATLRDMERELNETKRKLREKENEADQELNEKQALVDTLHDKLHKMDERSRGDVPGRAHRELARAEEEIAALQELLRAHEGDEGGRVRGTMKKLRETLSSRQREVERLKKALRSIKDENQDEIDSLLAEIDALRRALASNNQHIRGLWPGQWIFTPNQPPTQSMRPPVYPGPPPPPPPQGTFVQNVGSADLQPGTPGMIALQEDGSYILAPFEGLFCNVPEHHHLEDEVAELQEALEKCREKRKSDQAELEELHNLVGPLEEGGARLHHMKEVMKNHEEMIEKMRKDEERMSKERVEVAKELADLKDTLAKKLDRKHQLEGRVEDLLGELRTEQALLQQDEMHEELTSLERMLGKRRGELREADVLLRESREEAEKAEEKCEAMTKRYDITKTALTEAEQDAEELERQASETGAKLVRARSELRMLQEQVKEAEGRKIKLDDQCRQLARLVTNKEAEYTALEQKTDHMTGNLERLQSELILAEEKEAERLGALRESEKVLAERREELNKLKDQAVNQRDELESLDRLMGKKNTELQLLQENIEQHQNELSTVLKEGKADVQEKQKQIKHLRHEVDDLTSSRNELDAQVIRKREEVSEIREMSDKASEELQNKISEVNKQKTELKHVLEMLGLEHQELESLRRQHDTKSSELAEAQRRLLEEKAELERMTSDAQRKEVDLARIKENVEKLRSDVDCLTMERSTLEDTVTSLVKEKDMLTSCAVNLDDKIQSGKKSLMEIRSGIDKSGATLDQLEQELSKVRKEVFESNQQKNQLNKEIASMRGLAKDLKSDVSTFKTELTDTQEQLQILEQDLRSVCKHRDDASLEAAKINEELRARNQQCDVINREIKRRKEENEREEEEARARREEEQEKEKQLQRLSREIEREEDRLSRVVAELNSDIQRLNTELTENRDELEAIVIKRDATMRDMERLGRVESKFEETESRIDQLESMVADRDLEVTRCRRECSDLKGALASTDGELRATKVENEHDMKRIQQRTLELKEEMEQQKQKDRDEISMLERTAQDHCERAARLSRELNHLRADFIQAKKEVNFLTEERARHTMEMERMARRIRTEVDTRVSEGVDLLNESHSDAVAEMKMLYKEKETAGRKLHTLKEIQRGRSPPRSGIPHVTSSPSHDSMRALQSELQAKQEEIANQIRTQMSRHREQWNARKIQSEGKLRSLRRKVDNLDELVSNTSMDSLSHSRGRELNFDDSRISSTIEEERENIVP